MGSSSIKLGRREFGELRESNSEGLTALATIHRVEHGAA
jgi:hypothetical protein